jgi:RNA polymerase sigma-70 factor (ECF subfamily)
MTKINAHESAAPEDPQEKALVAELSVRNPAAVSEFLERTHRPVYAMTARLTTDPDLRHDWSQEILLKILDELAKGRFVYRWPGCFWSWFGKRSHFLLINLYRRQKNMDARLDPIALGEEVIGQLDLPARTDPLRLMENVEARAIMEECLARLDNEDQRHALTRVLLAEDSYQTIADDMDTPLNTIRSWIRRARVAVRKCIEVQYEQRPKLT